jgi:hypothetical protein
VRSGGEEIEGQEQQQQTAGQGEFSKQYKVVLRYVVRRDKSSNSRQQGRDREYSTQYKVVLRYVVRGKETVPYLSRELAVGGVY